MARKRSSVSKTAEQAVKKSHPAAVILTIVFLIVGIAAGVLVSRQITKNDKFILNGEKIVQMEVGGAFVDEGATVISFGRDISSGVQVGGDELNVQQEGIYQLIYTVDDIRWGEYQLVRVIIVGNPEGAEDFLNG